MDAKVRFAITVLAAAALSAMVPLLAFADDPLPTTTTITPPTPTLPVGVTGGGSISTTGTTATATVPGTGSVGGPITITSPTTGGVSTGTGPASVTGSAPISQAVGTQTSVSVPTQPTAGDALAAGSSGVGASLGTTPGVSASDPTTRSSVKATAQAHVVLCLLAQWSIRPSQSVLSSLCETGPSSSDAGADVGATNDIAGAALETGATVRAAVCLLGLVTTPAPSHVDPNDLGHASLSSLCGAGPSTVDGSNDTNVTSSRTGTDVSVGPIVSAASCLLANGVAGTTTAVELATTCSMLAGGSPSGGATIVPIVLRDGITGTSGDLAPAANAAVCVLGNALVTVPDSAIDSSATASLNSACTATIPTSGPSPSGGSAVVPTSGGGSPASVDLVPAANAALCILANAHLAASGSNADLADACGAGTSGGNPGPSDGGGSPTGNTGENPGTGTGGSANTGNGGTPSGPSGGTTEVGPAGGTTDVTVTGPAGGQPGAVGGVQTGTTPGGVGSVTVPAAGTGPAGATNGVEIPTLPSTSTAVASGGALLAILAATLVALRRRRD